MENTIILTTPKEIENIVLSALKKHEETHRIKENENKFYSINKVAKMLNRSHTTISKFVNQGIIKTTADGRISQSNLDEYLNISN